MKTQYRITYIDNLWSWLRTYVRGMQYMIIESILRGLTSEVINEKTILG